MRMFLRPWAVAIAGCRPYLAGPSGQLRSLTWFGLLLGLLPRPARAQNDVMLQAFYWNVPTASSTDGNWWDNLKGKAPAFKSAGFTALWVPPPSKGNFGSSDVGYGILDHYDLGSYNQRGTTETRYGSRAELDNMLTALRGQGIQTYADIVMNHVYSNDDHSEVNPAVRSYVFNESKINGTQYQNYPTGEIKWVLPAQTAGDYYIQIKGYNLPSSALSNRGYELVITYGNAGSGPYYWESEPNNGNGQSNTYPGSGIVMRGRSDSGTDVDEYKVTLTSTQDITIRLVPKQDGSGTWQDAPATNGFYPVSISKNGASVVGSLQARTNTGIKNLPTKTGVGETTLSWTYSDFHPATTSDFLTYDGPGVQPNVKAFGNDFNTYSSTVQSKLNAWGQWLVNTVKFDGFRLDYVRGYQPEFLASWIKALPKAGSAQRFVVCEYWESAANIKSWVSQMSSLGTDAKAFDFPLKATLTSLCNSGQSFNIGQLNHAGLVRSSTDAVASASVVTFLENHDTGKESDKWVTRDYQLGYAYVLTHEGRPCVFYPQYYGIQQVDNNGVSGPVTAPAALRDDINKLMFARRTYLGGSLAVLTETGNPYYPSGNATNIYVARRQGNGTRNGAIVVLNNNESGTVDAWVDGTPAGYQSWTGLTLVNAFNPSETTVVQADGRVRVWAPKRGYAVWVRQSEYVAYAAPAARSAQTTLGVTPAATVTSQLQLSLTPNPATGMATVSYELPATAMTTITLQNLLGQTVRTLRPVLLPAGPQAQQLPLTGLAAGTYLVRLQAGEGTQTTRLLVE